MGVALSRLTKPSGWMPGPGFSSTNSTRARMPPSSGSKSGTCTPGWRRRAAYPASGAACGRASMARRAARRAGSARAAVMPYRGEGSPCRQPAAGQGLVPLPGCADPLGHADQPAGAAWTPAPGPLMSQPQPSGAARTAARRSAGSGTAWPHPDATTPQGDHHAPQTPRPGPRARPGPPAAPGPAPRRRRRAGADGHAPEDQGNRRHRVGRPRQLRALQLPRRQAAARRLRDRRLPACRGRRAHAAGDARPEGRHDAGHVLHPHPAPGQRHDRPRVRQHHQQRRPPAAGRLQQHLLPDRQQVRLEGAHPTSPTSTASRARPSSPPAAPPTSSSSTPPTPPATWA